MISQQHITTLHHKESQGGRAGGRRKQGWADHGTCLPWLQGCQGCPWGAECRAQTLLTPGLNCSPLIHFIHHTSSLPEPSALGSFALMHWLKVAAV